MSEEIEKDATSWLPQEIWDKILELVSPESRGPANSEVRNRLSVESFAPGLPLQPNEDPPGLRDLLNFVILLYKPTK